MTRLPAVCFVAITLLASVAAQQPTLDGCFSSIKPLVYQGYYKYQSSGYCNGICQAQNRTVLGLSQGVYCWCGNELPATSTNVSLAACNTTCQGYGLEDCGGSSGSTLYYTVWLTGLQVNVPTYNGSLSSSSSSVSTSTAAATSSTTSSTTSSAAAATTSSSSSSKSSSTSSSSKTKTAVPARTRTRTSSKTKSSTARRTSTSHSSSPTASAGAAQASPKYLKHQHGDQILAIVLGVVLGVIALGLLAFLSFWVHRRTKKYGHPAHRSDPREFAAAGAMQSNEKKAGPLDGEAANNPAAPSNEEAVSNIAAPVLTVQHPTPRGSSLMGETSFMGETIRESSFEDPVDYPPVWRSSSVPARRPIPGSAANEAAVPERLPTLTEPPSNDNLSLPAAAAMRRSPSTESRASSVTDPFYTPLEHPLMVQTAQTEPAELEGDTSQPTSMESMYSIDDSEEGLTALPIQRPGGGHGFPVPGRDPPGRSGGYELPTSSEVRDFNFNDRGR